MYSYEEQCVMDLSDNYTLLYSFLGREVLDAFGVEGERAFREGTRRYGRDRGQCSREKHQALGSSPWAAICRRTPGSTGSFRS